MLSRLKTFPPLPREHGAWAMFGVPLLMGVAVAEKFNAQVLLFAIVALGFYLWRYPLMLVVKNRAPKNRGEAIVWCVIYGLLTVGSGAILLIVSQLWLLIPLGMLGALSLAIYLWLASRREEMTTLGEWLGIAGLALGAPGAYLAATGLLDEKALGLYALNLFYFGGTVLYIKFKVREQPKTVLPTADVKTRLWAGRMTMLYHVLVIIAFGIFAGLGWVPALVALAFGLPFCKVLSGVLTRPARLNLPRLGLIELIFTGVFTLVVVLAFYGWSKV